MVLPEITALIFSRRAQEPWLLVFQDGTVVHTSVTHYCAVWKEKECASGVTDRTPETGKVLVFYTDKKLKNFLRPAWWEWANGSIRIYGYWAYPEEIHSIRGLK